MSGSRGGGTQHTRGCAPPARRGCPVLHSPALTARRSGAVPPGMSRLCHPQCSRADPHKRCPMRALPLPHSQAGQDVALCIPPENRGTYRAGAAVAEFVEAELQIGPWRVSVLYICWRVGKSKNSTNPRASAFVEAVVLTAVLPAQQPGTLIDCHQCYKYLVYLG